MCIAVFLWQAHPLYPFILLHNRDEYYQRATKPLSWWDEEDGEILGGRDEVAGGTWLACSRIGRIAFVTNVREVESLPLAKTRGDLAFRFLKSKKSPREFAKEVSDEACQYNGFNLILTDINSRSMVYVTNRPIGDNALVQEVSSGVHVLTNARLDSPWPKAERLGHSFTELLYSYGNNELHPKEMVEKIMTDTTKDDESMLPHIYSPRREYCMSSIFVEADFPMGRYGTRSMSMLFVKSCGEVIFYERHLDNELWKENTVTYQLEKMTEIIDGGINQF